MPRVYTPEGDQLAWIGEAIGEDVETYEIPPKRACVTCKGEGAVGDSVPRRLCVVCQGKGGPGEVLRYTRDGITWELTARRVRE